MENNFSLSYLHETPLVLILAQIKPVHASAFYFLVSISILSSPLGLLLKSPFGFHHQGSTCLFCPIRAPRPTHLSSIFNYPNKLTFDVKYKLWSFSLSVFLSYTSYLLVRFKYFHQIVLNYVRLRFFLKMRLYVRSFVLFKLAESCCL
jgi:hypothetical protein